VVVKIDGKGDGATADRMARWAISLLQQAGADFAVLIGAQSLSQAGIQHPASSILNPVLNIIIPSEAVPGMPHVEAEFTRIIAAIEEHLKKGLPRSEGISVLLMGEYIPLFYSVNEVSGSANIPVTVDKLDAEPGFGSLSEVQVMQDWWDVPGEASAEIAEIFKKVVRQGSI
jgi:hypothetical protein